MLFILLIVVQFLTLYIANSDTSRVDGMDGVDDSKAMRNSIAMVIYVLVYVFCLVVTYFTTRGVTV